MISDVRGIATTSTADMPRKLQSMIVESNEAAGEIPAPIRPIVGGMFKKHDPIGCGKRDQLRHGLPMYGIDCRLEQLAQLGWAGYLDTQRFCGTSFLPNQPFTRLGMDVMEKR